MTIPEKSIKINVKCGNCGNTIISDYEFLSNVIEVAADNHVIKCNNCNATYLFNVVSKNPSIEMCISFSLFLILFFVAILFF